MPKRRPRIPVTLTAAGLLVLQALPAARADWPACAATDLTAAQAITRDIPPYPEAARDLGTEGYVDVSFVVLRDGTVGWARVLGADPKGLFEDAALNGVRAWRFQPAKRQGEPVECRYSTRVKFKLVTDPPVAPAG